MYRNATHIQAKGGDIRRQASQRIERRDKLIIRQVVDALHQHPARVIILLGG